MPTSIQRLRDEVGTVAVQYDKPIGGKVGRLLHIVVNSRGRKYSLLNAGRETGAKEIRLANRRHTLHRRRNAIAFTTHLLPARNENRHLLEAAFAHKPLVILVNVEVGYGLVLLVQLLLIAPSARTRHHHVDILVRVVPFLAARIVERLSHLRRQRITPKLLLGLPMRKLNAPRHRVHNATVVLVDEEMPGLKMLEPKAPVMQLAVHGTRASPASILKHAQALRVEIAPRHFLTHNLTALGIPLHRLFILGQPSRGHARIPNLVNRRHVRHAASSKHVVGLYGSVVIKIATD